MFGGCKIWIMIGNYCLDCDYIAFWWDWLVSVKKFKIIAYVQATQILWYGCVVGYFSEVVTVNDVKVLQ